MDIFEEYGNNCAICSEIPADTENDELRTYLLQFGEIKYFLFLLYIFLFLIMISVIYGLRVQIEMKFDKHLSSLLHMKLCRNQPWERNFISSKISSSQSNFSVKI